MQIYGAFELLLRQHSSVFAYKRFGGGKTAIVLLNFSDTEVSVNLDGVIDSRDTTMVFSNYEDVGNAAAPAGLSDVHLRGWEGILYVLA